MDLKRLLDSGDLSQNISIVGGDVITIPPRKTEFVYVLGYVKRPGAYVIDKDNDVRALWAVAQAGGLTAAARPQNVVLIREKDGKRISLDLRAIAKGQSPPLYMKPGDTLIVGSNAFMKLIDWVNPAANVGVTASPIP